MNIDLFIQYPYCLFPFVPGACSMDALGTSLLASLPPSLRFVQPKLPPSDEVASTQFVDLKPPRTFLTTLPLLTILFGCCCCCVQVKACCLLLLSTRAAQCCSGMMCCSGMIPLVSSRLVSSSQSFVSFPRSLARFFLCFADYDYSTFLDIVFASWHLDPKLKDPKKKLGAPQTEKAEK